MKKGMKNIYSAVVALALVAGITSCDYNSQFEGYEDMAKPSDVRTIEYTMTEADYAEIDALSGNYFSADATAADNAPSLIASLWSTVDNGSSVKLTYNYQESQPEYLADLASASDYKVSGADYSSVWGDVAATYFTPEKPFAASAYKILGAALPDATEGDIVVVEYNYSAVEPSVGGAGTSAVTELFEDFGYINESGAATSISGWINYAESGSSMWTDKVYSDNGYTQCSAYGASSDAITWLVTPQIDLSAATAPSFSFDTCLGYANGAKLQVLVSEDFNGSEESCASATWEDITANFAFETPASGYGKLSPAGVMDMSAYVGKKIYVAFKYIGDASHTTTFQLDNVEFGESSSVVVAETFIEGFDTEDNGWSNQTISGDLEWVFKEYSNNGYMQVSAYKKDAGQETFLISPEVTIPAEGVNTLSFEVAAAHWNAACLSVLVSENYTDDAASASWEDITSEFTIPKAPTSGYGDMAIAGSYSLSKFEGKSIRIAFMYAGGGDATSTFQLDNIAILNLSRLETKASTFATTRAIDGVHTKEAIYTFNGSSWAPYADAHSISSDDYSEMGLASFGSSALPTSYIPTWLNMQLPYAQEEDAVAVVYDWGSDREAAEYIFTDGKWIVNDAIVVMTDQFVLADCKWAYNPSVVINLVPVKGDAFVASYYQTAVDWVWKNIAT